MIGVRRQVNREFRLAGDAVGRADLRALENICRDYAENRFLVSCSEPGKSARALRICAKVQQSDALWVLVVLEQSFHREEITRERIELLGTSFIPQHSDAGCWEQVLYKWRNTRATMSTILANSYKLLARDGRGVTRQIVQRDVNRLFRGNFEKWTTVSA